MKEKVNRKVNEVRHWFFEQPTKLIKFSRFTKKQTRITNTRNEKKKKKKNTLLQTLQTLKVRRHLKQTYHDEKNTDSNQ